MATDQSLMDHLLDCMADAGDVHARKMFGEYGVYLGAKVVAFVCDNQLFMKPTEAAALYKDECEAAPPYPGAKDYWRVPEEKWDDRRWLASFIRDTAAVVPEPKPKKKATR